MFPTSIYIYIGWPQSIGFLFRNEYVVGWFFGSSIYSRTTAIAIETIGKWGDCLPKCFHHILYLASKWPSWFVLVETTNLNQNAVLFLKDWNIFQRGWVNIHGTIGMRGWTSSCSQLLPEFGFIVSKSWSPPMKHGFGYPVFDCSLGLFQ